MINESIGELDRRRRRVLFPDPEGAERQRSRGLLLPRERIELLLDPGSDWPCAYSLSRDGVLFGFGTIDGRPVAYRTWDPTVKGGAGTWRGRRPFEVQTALIEKAALPLFNLTQSAGGEMDIDNLSSSFAAFAGGLITIRHVLPRRGTVLTAVLGRAFAPWTVSGSDFSVMTRKATMAFVSPLIIEQATGAKAELADVGGAEVSAKVTGQIDRVVEDEPAAIGELRTAFSYLPSDGWEHPPVVRTGDPIDRGEVSLRTIVPPYPNRPYDVRAVIELIVDRGSFIELQPEFAKSMVTGLARLDGRTVAILANQPRAMAGVITTASMTKARRLFRLMADFGIPLVSFADTPGLFTTKEEEHRRILTAATEFARDRLRPEVPKVCVVVGKAIGLGYFFMSGSDPEGMTFCWPQAQISYIGPEGGVRVAFRKQLAEAPDPRAMVDELAEPFRRAMNPWRGARIAGIDDIIDPAETRPRVIRALGALERRRRNRPA